MTNRIVATAMTGAKTLRLGKKDGIKISGKAAVMTAVWVIHSQAQKRATASKFLPIKLTYGDLEQNDARTDVSLKHDAVGPIAHVGIGNVGAGFTHGILVVMVVMVIVEFLRWSGRHGPINVSFHTVVLEFWYNVRETRARGIMSYETSKKIHPFIPSYSFFFTLT